MTSPDLVECGLEFMSRWQECELTLPEAVARLETITTDPHLVRSILERAASAGVIDRTEDRVRITDPGTPIRFDRDVVSREGEFNCRRCGSSLGTGWFLKLEHGEVGPFGSTCIRIVTGRE